MPDLFISYSRKDTEFVRKIHGSFINLKRDIWVDWEDIPPSADWWREIEKGIDSSNAFIFIISPDSIGSDVCNRELDYALKSNKRFIPVLHRELTTSGNYNLQLNRAISAHNWIYMREADHYETAFEKLLTTIDTDLDHVSGHTRFLIRANEWRDKKFDASFLLRGTEIVEASNWLTNGLSKAPTPSELQTEYIIKSSEVSHHRQRNQLAGVSVALFISIVLAVLAVIGFRDANIQRQNADDQRQIAERNADESLSFALASSAQLELARFNNDVALPLALEAVSIDEPPKLALNILGDAAFAPGTIRVMPGDSDFITLAVSADGQSAVTGNGLGDLQLWDVATGEITRSLGEPVEGVFVATVSVSPDSQFALAGYSDFSIRLFDLTTGEEVRRYEGEHTQYISKVQFMPDGKQFLSAAYDATLLLWDVETGEVVNRYTDHVTSLTTLAVSSDGKAFASGGTDNAIVLWNEEGVVCTMTGHQAAVMTLAFSPDGKTLLSGSGDHTVRLWDTETCQEKQLLIGHGDWVKSVSFVPHSVYALSASDDSTLILWDLRSGQVAYHFRGHDTYINVAEPLPDGKRALSASGDMTLREWRLFNGAQETLFYNPADPLVNTQIAVDVNSSSRVALSTTGETLTLWNLDSGEVIQTLNQAQEGHTGAIYDAALSLDAQLAASVSQDKTVILWNVATGAVLHRLEGHETAVKVVGFSPDNKWIASGDSTPSNTIILWDVATGEKIHTLTGHEATLDTLTFSPDGQILASGDQANLIILWDVATGEEIGRLTAHTIIWDLVFSEDGAVLVSALDDGVAILWDVAAQSEIRRFRAHQGQFLVTFDPFNGNIVTGAVDGHIAIWSSQTGQQLGQLTVGAPITAMDFMPDADRLFLGLSNGDLSIWSIAVTGLDDTKAWAMTNRYLYSLSCEEWSNYQLQQTECSE